MIVWDRLPAHRSRMVREFIELSEGHIVTEYLPAYAPELNPVEYIWAIPRGTYEKFRGSSLRLG